MSRAKKNKKKNGPSISIEEYREQLFGKHSEGVQRNIESDEFYKSAFEGLKSIESSESFDDDIHNLERMITKSSGYKTTKEISSQRKRWMIAASIVFGLIALSTLLVIALNSGQSSKNGQMAQNKVRKADQNDKAAPKTQKGDQILSNTVVEESPLNVADDEMNEAATTENNTGNSPADGSQNAAISPDVTADKDLQAPPSPMIEDETESVGETLDDETIVESEPDDYYTDQIRTETSSDVVAEKKQLPGQSISETSVSERSLSGSISTSAENTEASRSASVTSVESAMSLYEKGEYKLAIDQFNDVIKTNPANRKANYYIAISYMNIGKSSKAADHFDVLIDSPLTSYKDSSIWLKAKILANKNKKSEAKKLLEDLIQRRTRYAQEANELLQSL